MTFIRWIACIKVAFKRAIAFTNAAKRPARSSEFTHPQLLRKGAFPGKSIDLFATHLYHKDKRDPNRRLLIQEYAGWVKLN